ncbi:MAG: glycoside hydrolase family 9 protein [Lachnospiraceae bacterium]|nr:glycoside hydrolase family 9 protein [Lachnospiraceae bacterium]
MKYKRILTLLMVTALCLTGCEKKEVIEEEVYVPVSKEKVFQGMCGETSTIQVSMPTQQPSILVDLHGYETQDEKIAIFRGANLETEYYICDALTDEVMYIGVLTEQVYHEQDDEYISYGDFTGFKGEGTYYIKTDVIGESYFFTISQDVKKATFRSLLAEFDNTYSELAQNSYTAGCLLEPTIISADLMFSYRLYPGIYTDDLIEKYSANKIPDVLEMIKIYTDWLLTLDTSLMLGDDLAAYAGVLSEFYEAYREFDRTYANSCKKAAENAYGILEDLEDTQVKPELKFYADAGLYNVTGYNKYNKAAKAYLEEVLAREEISTEKSNEMAEAFDLLGKVSYISGTKGVDIKLCADIMNEFMDASEQVSGISKESPYRVYSEDMIAILRELQKMVIVDFAVSSQEYRNVLENHYHYILGRNKELINYLVMPQESLTESQNQEQIKIKPGTWESALFVLMITEIMESGK